MEMFTLVTLKKARGLVLVESSLLVEICTVGCGRQEQSLALAASSGQTARSIQALSQTTH